MRFISSLKSLVDYIPFYREIKDRFIRAFKEIPTFFEESLQGDRLRMCKASGWIVLFGVRNHESEVGLKGKSILIHSFLKLGPHSAEVHWVLDNVEVTGELNLVLMQSD